ncbi:MAG: histidine phosphatase family protein, partial [Granulosicoccaceae bacterium]
MTDTIIDFIRHGEPIGGRAYRGHNIDDPLSEKGWQQMWDAVGEHCPWSHIVSSPLLRCLDFARALADKHDLSISIDERLKEVGFGEWEGKTPDQIKQQRLTEYSAFYADPVNKRPPGAEDLDSFIQRVTRAYQDIADYYTGKQVLVVAHAGVMRAI